MLPLLLKLAQGCGSVAEALVLPDHAGELGSGHALVRPQLLLRRRGGGQQGARLHVEQLGADEDEVGEGVRLHVLLRLDVLPVLVGDLREGERGYVEFIALDEVEKKIERPREAVDLQLKHVVYYSGVKRRRYPARRSEVRGAE